MDILNSIILGIVQGSTEFLPISSSGHLIIFRDILGIQTDSGLAFDAVLQLATTFAVLVYFWKDISSYVKNFFLWIFRKKIETENKNVLLAIIFGTIPAVVLGFLLEESMDTVFRNSNLVALTLVLGALIMFFADKFSEKLEVRSKKLKVRSGFLIGCFQALALVPGMSRSGMTISGGLFSGLNRELATKFSFLLAFPILLGSGLKKLLDLYTSGNIAETGVSLLFGSITAFVVGLLAIHFLVSFLKKNSMKVFVIYRIMLAIFILIVF